MDVTYGKLFQLLVDKKVSYRQLMKEADISRKVISNLKHNKLISPDVIEKICEVLHCNAEDIMEFIPKKKYHNVISIIWNIIAVLAVTKELVAILPKIIESVENLLNRKSSVTVNLYKNVEAMEQSTE